MHVFDCLWIFAYDKKGGHFGLPKESCENHFHDHILLRGEEGWTYEFCLTRHFLLKCLYQTSKVSDHSYVYWGADFAPFCDFSIRFVNFPIVWYFLFFTLFSFPFLEQHLYTELTEDTQYL